MPKFNMVRGQKKMANLIAQQNTDLFSKAELKIIVTLSDMEQPIVDSTITHSEWDFPTSSWITTTEPRKFKITHLSYEYDTYDTYDSYYPTERVLRLSSVQGVYFLKGDKKIGKRETHFWGNLPKELVNQIPDKLHEYARQELATELKKQIDRVLSHGVVIEGVK